MIVFFLNEGSPFSQFSFWVYLNMEEVQFFFKLKDTHTTAQ